jgi:hypothetical protein
MKTRTVLAARSVQAPPARRAASPAGEPHRLREAAAPVAVAPPRGREPVAAAPAAHDTARAMAADATVPDPGAIDPGARGADGGDRLDPADLARRVAGLDREALERELDAAGHAVIQALLRPAECAALAGLYDDDGRFRSRVVMERHRYGRGEYRYFAAPLPAAVQALREAFYPLLAPLANRWHAALGLAARFPAAHADFLARCHAAGQTRPTPLLLRYGPGDYNCLHQDLYGEHVFPLQLTLLLSRPGGDFEGGEFVLAEQRPRRQSRVEVVPLRQGDAVVFAVRQRPVAGARGPVPAQLRHGVSRLRAGRRHTLGLIFHDAT